MAKTKKRLSTNRIGVIKPLNQSICAPFIEPIKLSKSHKLSQANINIIKSATSKSCFTLEALRKIADKWNATYPNHINYTDKTTGKMLWNAINSRMIKRCNTERCWIQQDFIKYSPLEKELLMHFKPLMPKKWENNTTEWLNTLDIRDVMVQYETKYPNFEFIGPVPIDFDTKLGFGQCVINELCNINLESLIKQNKTKIGVIFNLDKHNEPGSHWVAMYCDISLDNKCGDIYYWDSYGLKPEDEIVRLMEKLKQQGEKLEYRMKIKINNIRHQYKTSECGVYCIYFLTSLLAGKTFTHIIKTIISDDKMNKKRFIFFAKHK